MGILVVDGLLLTCNLHCMVSSGILVALDAASGVPGKGPWCPSSRSMLLPQVIPQSKVLFIPFNTDVSFLIGAEVFFLPGFADSEVANPLFFLIFYLTLNTIFHMTTISRGCLCGGIGFSTFDLFFFDDMFAKVEASLSKSSTWRPSSLLDK